jgi:mono/diheme cytochrome c family protein
MALLVVVVFGVSLPTLAVLVWLTSHPPPPPARHREVAIPPYLLPKIVLPTGSDPQTIALRRSIREGEHIYQRLCYNCHSRTGKGDANEYMESIGHKPADHTDAAKMQKLTDWEFFIALRDGVKDDRGWFTMPPWESVLTPEQMWAVIAYVRRLPGATQNHP